MAEQEPTAWELMRILQTVQDTLGRMEGRMLSIDQFRTYQESNERRFASLENQQNAWTTESRGEHVRLDGKLNTQNESLRGLLDTYREKQEALERASREGRSRTWLAIGVSILGFLLTIASGFILNGVNP